MIAPLGFHTGTLNIILPVGISFYTFQTLSYTIDVFRKNIETCDDPADFALFVAFFPQLVAGPIVRASEFLPQLKAPRVLSWDRTLFGFRQFVFGLVKKVFVADRVALFVDGAFTNPGGLDTVSTWLSILAWAVQVYCDFSGYSDMAIGVARILGYDLNENFRHPFNAINLHEHWKRWHISLATWLRDYLYIPLGGNRKGRPRADLNMFITMTLGGLWHGAAWTFIAWGSYNGAALAIHRWIEPIRKRFHNPGPVRKVIQGVLGWTFTQMVVLVGYVAFRAQNMDETFVILKQMYGGSGGVSWHPPFAFIAIFIVAITHAFDGAKSLHKKTLLPHNRGYTPVLLIAALIFVYVTRTKGYTPFIYFQF